MRAKEFVTEQKTKGKLSKRQQHSTVGLNIFTDSNFDRFYMLNRMMMAVASTDGTFEPDMDAESWVAKHNAAFPYTQVEQDMLHQAYKATGVMHKDLNGGDLNSKELDSTNKQSPVKPFKGYKK